MPVSIFGALKMMVVTNLHIVKTGDGYDLRDPKNSRFVMVVTAETVTELIEKEWISPLDDAGESISPRPRVGVS